MSTLDKQAMFDAGVRHIIKQGRAAYIRLSPGDIKCLYRGPGGAACLVGGLIPDHKYRPELDNQPGTSSCGCTARVALREIDFTDFGYNRNDRSHGDFADVLQQTHDKAAADGAGEPPNNEAFLVRFVDRARHLASQHSLNTTALDAAIAENGGAQ